MSVGGRKGRPGEKAEERQENRGAARRKAGSSHSPALFVFLTFQVLLDVQPILAFPWLSPPVTVSLGTETVQDMGPVHLSSSLGQGAKEREDDRLFPSVNTFWHMGRR